MPPSCNSQDIISPPFDLTIRTDASLQGWSATWQGRATGDRWSVEEADQHINCLELKAAILAFKSFPGEGTQLLLQGLGQLCPHQILLETENTTAVTYVNRRGALGH